MKNIIKVLFDLEENDKKNFGSKAVNLSKLNMLGVNVPFGYCISQELHDYNIQSNNEIPEYYLDKLKEIYTSFENEPIVVRSSSLSEDLEGSSYAGLYES